jgi:hypothetical protein
MVREPTGRFVAIRTYAHRIAEVVRRDVQVRAGRTFSTSGPREHGDRERPS